MPPKRFLLPLLAAAMGLSALAPPAHALLYPSGVSDTIVPMGRNDDSYWSMALPFTFNLYGTSYNTVWINNNGNLSFNGGYSTYTANGFPDSNHAMVAPFWADVDTRNTDSGLCRYSVTANSLIVTWDHVGYFGSHADKLDTFQVAISNGTNPTIGLGKNVAFSYDSMNWTTGDASYGSGGVGGVPATVGINKGDGTHFVQIGRYDHAGFDYNGPTISSGVQSLNNTLITFDASGGAGGGGGGGGEETNLPPVAVGIPTGGFVLQAGAAFHSVISFLGPETDQFNTITNVIDVDNAAAAGLSDTIFSPGTVSNHASATLDWTPDASLVGHVYHVTYQFTDNLGLAATATATFTIAPAPEPATVSILGLGVLALLARRRP